MKRQKLRLSERALISSARLYSMVMFSFDDPKGLWNVLHREGIRVNVISLGDVRGLRVTRVRRFYNYVRFLQKMKVHHGTSFTLRWMKACTVALQRAVARQPVKSLREIEPGLPLPRVARSGLPQVIGTMDRAQIMRFNTGVIRLWMSWFSLYRIISGPMKPKLETITAPFSGDLMMVDLVTEFTKQYLWYWIRQYKVTEKDIRTASSEADPYNSRSAGPNTKLALSGILADSMAWFKLGKTHLLETYLKMAGGKFMIQLFEDLAVIVEQLVRVLPGKKLPVKFLEADNESFFIPRLKRSVQPDRTLDQKWHENLRLGQLSFKEEAAGKLRVFAVTDMFTQWALMPLHNTIFRILKRLPMDCTFDQGAGVRRISEIAARAGCAYSFDLSAATDRLPVLLQGRILEVLTRKPGFGSAWVNLLTDRDWVIPANDYGLSGRVRYSVGQPMGALSSWGMLALTHHVIVQCAAWRAGLTVGKFEDYVVLGDDIVICHSAVADQYLAIMRGLGVEINLAKSLCSTQAPVTFEFAKRLIVGGISASPISFRQMTSANNLAARVQNLLYFGELGMVPNITVIRAILARFGSDIGRPLKSILRLPGFVHGILGALGALSRKGLFPLELLVEACTNPHDEVFQSSPFRLPCAQAMSFLLGAFKGVVDLKAHYPWSQCDVRQEVAADASSSVAEDVILLAAKARKDLADTYDEVVETLAGDLIMINPKYQVGDLRSATGHDALMMIRQHNPVLAAQLLGLAEMLIVGDRDPSDFYSELGDKLLDPHFRPGEKSLEEALAIASATTAYVASFTLDPVPPVQVARNEGWLALRLLRLGLPNVQSLWRNPTVTEYTPWPIGTDKF